MLVQSPDPRAITTPKLKALVDDPMICLVMKSDGVKPAEVLHLFASLQKYQPGEKPRQAA